MLRPTLRTNVQKLQPLTKLTKVTCKPWYHLFYIALLTPGEDQPDLSRFSKFRTFASTRKLHLTSL
jgi:hypothetical protein